MDIVAPLVIYHKHKSFRIVAMVVAMLCLIGILSQTAQAENTYVIKDGVAVTVHTTSESDPAAVLQEAGFALASDDIYTTAPGDGVSEITVRRALEVLVQYNGYLYKVSSYGESVKDLFVRLGIAVDDSIQASVSLEAMTYDGMEITVDNVYKTIESYTVEIPFETRYCEDPTLAAGEEKVLVEGKAGEQLCTANVVYINTQEQSRTVYENTILTEPIDRVIAVGTGVKTGDNATEPIIGDGFIVLPTGEVLTYTHSEQFLATAYTKTDDGCDEITANGAQVKWGVVAIDPSIIPYGTRMFIVSNDGVFIYGLSTAEDCGGDIVNRRLDLYMDSYRDAINFGVRECTVYFLGGANWQDN